MPLTVSVDRAIRKSKSPPLALKDLRIDAPEKEFSCLLGVNDLTRTAKKIPGNLKGAFYKDG
jgi:hypothetical protein